MKIDDDFVERREGRKWTGHCAPTRKKQQNLTLLMYGTISCKVFSKGPWTFRFFALIT